MRNVFRLAMIGIISATAAGCATPSENGPVNDVSVHKVYPIRVEPLVASLPVQVDTAGLARGEEGHVEMFAQHWLAKGQGKLSVAVPAGTSNQAGAKAAVRQIRSILSEAGVDGAAIQTTTYPGARDDEQAPITLSFMTFAALAQECGQNWSENIAFTPRNLPWPEFGCSTQRNFAASVSNPMDLKAPRAEGKSDALRRGVVLSKYRVGQPTGATMSDDASGSVSEVK